MSAFIDKAISTAFTYNGWLNVTVGGLTTCRFLDWSGMNESREYKAFISVACKLMIGGIVTIDFGGTSLLDTLLI